MNKTVTINISGIIFHIEEDAYETLSKYILTIKGYFSKADGGNEIMSDIEARIAEMLQSKTSSVKQVVLMSDVDFVMESMGKPEEFGGEQSNGSSDETNQFETSSSDEPIKKRVYRDGDSKIIGGVCSGIGHYFGFDPVWLRIALALLLVFGGTGVLLYIILWIAIPEAKTTAEKLAMKGEKADINNISKAVKEEAEQLKKRMEKYGDDFKNMANNHKDVPRNAVEKIVDFLSSVLMNIGRILVKILGIFLVIFGVFFFLGLFGVVSGVSIISFDLGASEWINLFLLDGKDFYLGIIGLSIFLGTPIIMMIYGGVKILFKVNYTNRWVNLSAGILWLFGFFMVAYVAIRTVKDFKNETNVRETKVIDTYQTLVLKMNETSVNYEEICSNDDEEGIVNIRQKNDHYLLGKNKNNTYLLGVTKLKIIKSQSTAPEIILVKGAKGGDKRVANDRAKKIDYSYSQSDSVLVFNDLFRVNNIDKFRFQDLTIILKIPVGQVIYLDKSMEHMLYNVDNTTDTYDGDMVSRRWIMTENGLKCLDCKGLDEDKEINSSTSEADDESSNNEKGIKITVNGVDINAKDSQVKLDSNGVKIDSKNTKLTIDEKGIHINTDKKK